MNKLSTVSQSHKMLPKWQNFAKSDHTQCCAFTWAHTVPNYLLLQSSTFSHYFFTWTMSSRVSSTSMLASFERLPSKCESISVSETYRPLTPDTSKPLRDSESPDCMAFRRKEALCQRRLWSGLGDGGKRSADGRMYLFKS